MRTETASGIDRGFVRLALSAAVVTFLMIIIGSITRVSESGMGCGTYWPSCNGLIIPEFVNAAVAIEFGHRLFALLVGIFALAVVVQAWRYHRDEPRLMMPAALGFVLYIVQSGLGALTVGLSNEWVSVLLHLGNSMFLLACYLVLWVNARQDPDSALNNEGSPLPLTEVLLTATLTFLVVLIGAAVAGNNATKACDGWPLCGGEIWPTAQGPFQMLNMLHRLVAGSLGLMLLLMVFQIRHTTNRTLRNAVLAALATYLLQALLGAFVVFVNGREWLVVVRSLHVTFAAATWSIMVIVSTIAWLQQLSIKNKVDQKDRITASSATISS